MIREDLAPATAEQSWLDKSVGALVRVNWETVAWVALMLITVVTRFYDLGARAMTHDESLHAVYSFELYKTGNYIHNPMMHGPFLFHANALIYAIFGVTDATTRIIPALSGLGMVAMAWAFRRWLGKTGALLVGVLFVISPSILFHSRYIRNDIYIALSAMVWIYGMFRYLEDRQVRWLYVMVLGMVFGFVSKENQFMSGALFGAFTGAVALWRWWRNGEGLNRSVFADLAVLMLTLVLPFTSPFGYLVGEHFLGWETVNWSSFTASAPMLLEFTVMVVLATALATGIAYYWYGIARAGDERPRLTFAAWGGLMLTFWAIAIIFFTTFFTNPVNGLATGIVGSLGYWLAHQEVQRGSQPWYYYGIVAVLYEFLPLILSAGGTVALISGLLRKDWRVAPDHDLPASVVNAETRPDFIAPAMVRRILLVFLLWWIIGAWGAYSYAGEKMPWLLTHMAQPMALLGGQKLGC
ncbi:MAG: TIGR03663 family protein [Caldilineaceae bacterium]